MALKRYCAHAFCVSVSVQIPSWAILTNSQDYRFYKFITVNGERKLLTFEPISLVLRKGVTYSDAGAKSLPIVAFLKQIVEEQKEVVDRVAKRLRVGGTDDDQ